MTIGFVIGESKPTMVRAQTARPLAVGEYVIIDSTDKKILGLVEKSSVSSAAFADVQNYEEAFESKEIAESNIRDKSYISNIGILGFLDGLKKGTPVLPAIPPIPGTAILTATKEDLGVIFGPNEEVWIKIGKLLRNNTIDAKINLDKIVSRHLGILAMTGMGKSNLVALITKEIAKLKGTVIIFDYHNDYTFLDIPKINVIDAKINPRLLDADALSEVLEIRENANVQQRVLRVALTQTVKESKEFWNKLEREVDIIINSDDKKEKENRNSAYRVKDKIDDAQHRFATLPWLFIYRNYSETEKNLVLQKTGEVRSKETTNLNGQSLLLLKKHMFSFQKNAILRLSIGQQRLQGKDGNLEWVLE